MAILLWIVLLLFGRIRIFEAQCSYKLEGESGSFESPNYPQHYPPAADCNWTISVAPNHSVQLTFQDFVLETSDSCEFDKLIVRDGSDCIDPIMATLCGSDLPEPITSSGPNLYVQFVTSTFVQDRGFRASFTQVAPCQTNVNASLTCGTTLTDDHGTFSTPNYPSEYPSNIECVWKIMAPTGKRIRLLFEEFVLYYDCFMASVDVYDGTDCSKRILRHCGLRPPRKISSTGENLTVVFQSNGPTTLKGFQAHYFTFDDSNDRIPDGISMIQIHAWMIIMGIITFILHRNYF